MSHMSFSASRPFHRPWVVDYDLAAATAGPVTLKTARSASHQLYIRHIVISVTTYSAQTLTFKDTAGTPVPIALASVPAAAPTATGNQNYVIDFRDSGTPLTTGKNLSLVLSGAGVAGRIHIEGYEVIDTPVAAGSTN